MCGAVAFFLSLSVILLAGDYCARSLYDGLPLGDVDCNGRVNQSDLTKLVAYIFAGDSLGCQFVVERFVDTCSDQVPPYLLDVTVTTRWDTVVRPVQRTIVVKRDSVIVDIIVERYDFRRHVYQAPAIPDYDSIVMADTVQ